MDGQSIEPCFRRKYSLFPSIGLKPYEEKAPFDGVLEERLLFQRYSNIRTSNRSLPY